MRTSLLVVAVAVLVVLCSAKPAERYTSKFDNIDLDAVLRNERLSRKYVDCLLANTDEGCTADAKLLKQAIPEALANECAKCNERQKAGTRKVIAFTIKNRPDIWRRLEAKYDPSGQYRRKYEEVLKKEIKV